MTREQLSESFRCTRFSIALTRGACAKMYKRASAGHNGPGRNALTATDAERCRRCDIGAQHRRGEAADVQLVQLRAMPSPGAWTKGKPAGFRMMTAARDRKRVGRDWR